MRRSHSEPGKIICPLSLTSISQYARLQGRSPARSARASPAHEMRGGVLVKAAPDAEKTMRVDFEASLSTMKIILKQERDGVVHDFVLFTLDLATLFVGWDSEHQDVFVLGAKHQDKVFHPIFCYPCHFCRNRWLRFFEDNGCEVRFKRLETLEGLAHNRMKVRESPSEGPRKIPETLGQAARGCGPQPPKKIPQDMFEQADLVGRLKRLQTLEMLADKRASPALSASSARARLLE